MLPIEVFSALGRQELGIDPADMTMVVVAGRIPPGGGNGIPSVAAAIRTSKAIDREQIPVSLTGERRERELDGKPFWDTNKGVSVYFPTTILSWWASVR